MRDATAPAAFLPADAQEHMKALRQVMSAPSKYRMCIELTCGDKSADAKLEDRAPDCINGNCLDCGFGKLWTKGLRRSVATKNGKGLRIDAPYIFFEGLKWQNYAYRTKEKKRKSKKNKRGRRATTSYSDEDLLWANEKARKELFLQSRSGTLFAFLDELEPHLGKYMLHRSTLSRQKEASVVFDRERRPGIVSLDIDFAENLDIEEAMKVQSEHW